MFSPTSMSAMSMETISKAVCESKSSCQHGLGDHIGIRQHLAMVVGGTDGADDSFTDACDDRLFGRTADQLLRDWRAR